MKLSFSDKMVTSSSFIELCNIVQNYGFDGVEIFDAEKEKASHVDSIFRSSVTADAKRKLVNRHIAIPVLNFPESVTGKTDAKKIIEYVEFASLASISGVVFQFGELPSEKKLKEIFAPAISLAENSGVSLLFETVGPLVNTAKVLDVINFFASTAIKTCWNVRETFFTAKESADTTIQTLGAYIGYVKMGDRKDGKNVLIGDGELAVKDFMNALHSLNYDGYISVMDSGEVTSFDIILTHFKSYLTKKDTEKVPVPVYYNRSKTGTHPWKKYDVLDLTFS
jgi:fatty-acyl-CoA synthase